MNGKKENEWVEWTRATDRFFAQINSIPNDGEFNELVDTFAFLMAKYVQAHCDSEKLKHKMDPDEMRIARFR